MGPSIEVKVFNTKSNNLNFLKRICLAFNCININGVMMKLFSEVSKVHFSLSSTLSPPEIQIKSASWRSSYCYLNNGECNLNQSKDDSFVERVAKNNS